MVFSSFFSFFFDRNSRIALNLSKNQQMILWNTHNNILGLIIKKHNLRLLAQWHMLGYNIWQKKNMSQLLLLLKIHDPLPTWYSIIVPSKTILFYWFWGQNCLIPLFGKIHLIQYHCTFKDNTISLISRQKWPNTII